LEKLEQKSYPKINLYYNGETNMKSKTKLKITFLITLEIIFTLTLQITMNPSLITGNNSINNFDNEKLKTSAVSGKIHIDDDNPSINWTVAKNDGICTGNGTYSDPYIIEDLEIDGEGSGSCIWIDNSEVYFRIENCTLFNSGEDYHDAGIRLVNVNNGQILNNNCSNNNNKGIRLWNCNNSIISGNTLNKNGNGIALYCSHNNTISENTVNNSSIGILLEGHLGGRNNVVSGNLMNECGLKIHGNLEVLLSHEIDTTNLVNGKPLYYYTNEVNLRSYNFTNVGQAILVNCSDSLISNLNVSFTTIAISLHYCNNNIISGNTLNNNTYYSITLVYSNYNLISGNAANTNKAIGIMLVDSNNNTVSGNTVNDNTYHGMYLYNCNNNTVSENAMNNHNFNGMYLYNCNYNGVSENTMNNNNYHGMSFENSKNNIVSGNIVNNNNWSGMCLIDSNYNIISGNTVNHNTECGIVLFYSNYNTISGNNLIGNDECIVEVNCQGNVIQDNDCTLTPSLAYLPIIFTIGITIIVVSVFIIDQNRKRFRKPQEDLEFL
jgi:parallel beta-helix repeat protein